MLMKGGGRGGIQACVFEEFFIRCKETWSPIIDGTCLLIMNLPGCYRLPHGKFHSKLSFPNYCFVKTLSQGLLCIYIQDDGYRLCGVCGIGLPPSWIQWTLGESLTHSQSDDVLTWTLKDSFPTKCTNYVAETQRKLFRFITATMMRGLRRANTGT